MTAQPRQPRVRGWIQWRPDAVAHGLAGDAARVLAADCSRSFAAPTLAGDVTTARSKALTTGRPRNANAFFLAPLAGVTDAWTDVCRRHSSARAASGARRTLQHRPCTNNKSAAAVLKATCNRHPRSLGLLPWHPWPPHPPCCRCDVFAHPLPVEGRLSGSSHCWRRLNVTVMCARARPSPQGPFTLFQVETRIVGPHTAGSCSSDNHRHPPATVSRGNVARKTAARTMTHP